MSTIPMSLHWHVYMDIFIERRLILARELKMFGQLHAQMLQPVSHAMLDIKWNWYKCEAVILSPNKTYCQVAIPFLPHRTLIPACHPNTSGECGLTQPQDHQPSQDGWGLANSGRLMDRKRTSCKVSCFIFHGLGSIWETFLFFKSWLQHDLEESWKHKPSVTLRFFNMHRRCFSAQTKSSAQSSNSSEAILQSFSHHQPSTKSHEFKCYISHDQDFRFRVRLSQIKAGEANSNLIFTSFWSMHFFLWSIFLIDAFMEYLFEAKQHWKKCSIDSGSCLCRAGPHW